MPAVVADRAEVRSEFTLLRIDRLEESPELRLLVFIVLPADRVAIAVLALNHPVLAIVRLRCRPGEQPQVGGSVNHEAVTRRAPLLLLWALAPRALSSLGYGLVLARVRRAERYAVMGGVCGNLECRKAPGA